MKTLVSQTMKKTPPSKNARSFSEHRNNNTSSVKPYNPKSIYNNYLNLSKNSVKNEEITARFNKNPSHTGTKYRTNTSDSSVKNLIDILSRKINSVAASTQKFLSSAEKLSRYCEFSKMEAKIDLKNYQSEKSNIEKELINLSTDMTLVQKPFTPCENHNKSFCFEDRKTHFNTPIEKKGRFQTPPSKEKENDKNSGLYKASNLRDKSIEIQSLRKENEFLRKMNSELNSEISEMRDKCKVLVEKNEERKGFIKRLMEAYKFQGESDISKIKRNFQSLSKAEPIKLSAPPNIDELLKRADQSLSFIKEFIENKSSKSRFLELRRKRKEAEGLLINEKINKEQYSSLLEILRAIQSEEREIEEREGESVGYWQEIDNSLRTLEESIEGVRTLGKEMKVVKRKLKMVKNEKRNAENELNENRNHLKNLESFYQSEFSKLSQKVSDLPSPQQTENALPIIVSHFEFLQQNFPLSVENACFEISQRLQEIKSEVSRKNEEVQQLKFELDRQNNENEEEISKYRKEIEGILGEKRGMETALAKIREKLTETEKHLKLKKSLEEENNRLKVDLAAKGEELTNLKGKLGEKMKSLEPEIENFKARIQEANLENQRLKGELREKIEKLTEIEGLKARIQEFTIENQRLKGELREKIEKITENEQNLASLQVKYLQNEKNLREKENELRSMSNSFEGIREESKEGSKVIENFKRTERELKDSIRKLESRNQVLESEKLELEMLLKGQQNVESNEAILEELRSRIEENKGLEELIESSQAEMLEKDKKITEFTESLSAMEVRIKRLEKENNDLKVSEKKSIELNGLISTKNQEIQQLQGILEKQKNSLVQNERLIAEKSQEIQDFSRLIEKQRNNEKSRNLEAEQTKTRISELESAIQRKNAEAESLKTALSELRSSINSQVSELEKPKFELLQTQQILRLRTQELEESKGIIRDLKASLEEKCRAFNKTREELEGELDVKMERIRDLEKRFGDLERRNADLERRSGDWEMKNGDLDRKCCTIEKKNGDLERKCAELEKKCLELDRKYAESERKSTELEKKYVELVKKSSELERESLEKDTVFEEISRALEEGREALEQKIQENQALRQENGEIRVFAEEKDQENNELRCTLEEKERDITDFENRIREFEFIIQTNEIRIKELEDGNPARSLRTEEGETPNFFTRQDEVQQVEAFKSMVMTLQTEKESLISEYKEAIAKKETEIHKIEEELNIAKGSNKEMAAKVKGLENHIVVKEGLLTKNEKIIEELRDKVKSNEALLVKNERIIEEMKGNAKGLEIQISAKRKEIEEIKVSKAQKKHQLVDELNQKMRNLEIQLNAKNQEIEEFKKKNIELEQRLAKSLNNANASLNNELKELKIANLSLNEEVEHLREENLQLSSEIASLQEKIGLLLEKNVERPVNSREINPPNSQEFKSLLSRYQFLSREYEEINGIIREMITEFFPAEHCSESHSTRTLLLQIQRVIRQKNEEIPVENENNNEEIMSSDPRRADQNAAKGKNMSANEGPDEDVMNKGFDKGEDDEMDIENELEEYRMIIKHMEIALKDKDTEIGRLKKMIGSKEPMLKPAGMNSISEKDEEDEEEEEKKEGFRKKVETNETGVDKYKLTQAEITRLNKENEELRYLNEQLNSNLEKMQEEINDMQLNEEKFMMQIKLLKDEIDNLEKKSQSQNNQPEKEHIKSIFFKFLEELNAKNVNKGDLENYLNLLFSLIGVNDHDRDQHGLSSALFKSFDKKKQTINSFFKK